MNKLWKITIDNGNFAIVDLEKITHDEWVNDDGWARYHGREGFKPLTCRAASITYFVTCDAELPAVVVCIVAFLGWYSSAIFFGNVTNIPNDFVPNQSNPYTLYVPYCIAQ